ncbi:MAG: ParA family protein [Bryobacteraceae bacterium]
MPTIVMASPKGGAGKTTSALVLATTLSRRGGRVMLIEADRNKPLAGWFKQGRAPAGLTVTADVSEETIIDTIDEAAAAIPFVIVDLEGTASKMISYAISRADLVLIPTKASQLDATQAVEALREVGRVEKAFKLKIYAAVMITQTNPAIRPRGQAALEDAFAHNGVAVMETRLFDRQAYKEIFSYGCTLQDLDPTKVTNIAGAIENAEAFTTEVLRRLPARSGVRQAEVA